MGYSVVVQGEAISATWMLFGQSHMAAVIEMCSLPLCFDWFSAYQTYNLVVPDGEGHTIFTFPILPAKSSLTVESSLCSSWRKSGAEKYVICVHAEPVLWISVVYYTENVRFGRTT